MGEPHHSRWLVPRRRHDIAVEIYTRAGCGLCRRAEMLAAREAKRTHLAVIDVDADEALTQRFGISVPVVVVDGREIAAFEIAPGVIARAVRAARWHRRSASA